MSYVTLSPDKVYKAKAPIFTSLGLAPKGQQMNGKQWHNTLGYPIAEDQSKRMFEEVNK